MKKLLLTLLCFSALSAELPNATLTWDFATGYRQDDLKWNIAGVNGHPNVLSELTWTDLQMPEVSALFKTSFCNYLYFRTYADYGWILNGRNRDSDFDGDNRSYEWSRSTAKADRGHVWDASVAAGWTFPFCDELLWINPILGYSIHHQDLHMRQGNVVIARVPSHLGAIYGLNSTYNAHWKGFWAGVDLDYYLDCPYDIALRGTFEYHWNTQFHGTGHWNLRKEFLDDFHHKARGYGVILGLGVDYDLGCEWLIGISGNYQDFWTNPGREKGWVMTERYDSEGFIIGHDPTYAKTRLNRVQWHSWNVLGHLEYRF